MSDVLDKWQRNAVRSPVAAVPPTLVKDEDAPSKPGGEEYKGTKAKDRPLGWLVFKPGKGARVVCDYRALEDWEYDQDAGTSCITFYFRRYVILVTGRKLDELVMSLLLRTLTLIEEFKPGSHDAPAPEDMIVESIHITRIGVDAAALNPKPKNSLMSA
jgi:hypothetical protein